MANNPIVLNYQESLLRASDIEILLGPSWLNDTIISFYFEYLEVHKFQSNPVLLFVPPQVTQCIKITPASEISVFLNPLDSKAKDFIFFALNDNEQTEVSGGTHWSLLVFSYPERRCFHFDSSRGSNQAQAVELGTKVLRYLGFNPVGGISEIGCLQQNNGYDCGIHVLAQCEHLAQYALTHRCIEGCPMLLRDVVQIKRQKILDLINNFPCKGYGFDAGSDQGACGRPYRTSRMHQPPCDLAKESYCTHAGTTYPWHAVRRFIKENQGLMRRMYGDESHIEVLHGELRNEISQDPSNDDEGSLHWDLLRNVDYKMRYSKHLHEHNELYDDDDDDDDFAEEMRLKRDKEEARLLQNRREEIILNTKFIYGQDPGMQIKLKDLHAPKFRPTSSTTGRPSSTEDVSVSTNVNAASTTERVEEVKVKSKENETFVSAEGPSTVAGSSVVIDNETTVEFSGSTESLDAVDAETTTFGGFNDVGTEELGTTTTEANKKEHFAEVLFQDMDERPVASNVDFKVRGVNACPVKEEVVAPFWANNTRGEVLALLNLYPFEQYVHWEKCTYEHRQMYCREGCRCEQQYRLHRLLAYDPNNECRGIFSDWFRFPSCCVCKCYDMPAEFRVTSRSPRSKDPPHWFKKKKNGKQKYNNNNANKQHIN